MSATTAVIVLKRGAFLTDGKRLVEVRAVMSAGVKIEDALTLETELVRADDLVASGRWRAVELHELPVEDRAWRASKEE